MEKKVATPSTEIDPITLEVVRNRLEVIAEEMQIAMIKSAFSEIIKEGEDSSFALFDPKGQTIAQAKSLPQHLGMLVLSVKGVLKDYPAEGMQEGDIYIMNDPYQGGSHIPDLTMIGPITWEGRTVALAVIMAHQSDFGGAVIGGLSPDFTEIYQEGLCLPPLKLMSQGKLNYEIMEIILRNVRIPDDLKGDTRSMMAAIAVGKRRYLELCKELGGPDVTRRYYEELMDRSERITRQTISEIPQGTYRFCDYMDNDGIDLYKRVTIQVTATVKESDLILDFEGTDPQLKGAANSPIAGTHASCYYAVRAIVGPAAMTNAVCFRPLTIRVPQGTLLNPRRPAALGSRTMTNCRTLDAIFGALMPVMPQKLRACSSSMEGASFSGRRSDSGRAWVHIELFTGGMGARHNKDGVDYIENDITNMMNTPTEALETDYGSMLRINRGRFWTDSGGAGKFRGGVGMEKEFEMISGECEVTHRGDRHFTQPWGVFGGRPGQSWSTIIYKKDGSTYKVPARKRFTLGSGDRMVSFTAGGAGYGDPLERAPELVREDVLDRKVSEEAARNEYGVVLFPSKEDIVVDMNATEELRSKMREIRGSITWTFDRGGDLGRE